AGHRLRDLEDGCEVEVFDGRADRAPGARHRLLFPELRMELIELPYLAIGSPPQVAVAGFLQVRACGRLKPARPIEPRGQYVGKGLVVDKAVSAWRADGLFVKLLGVDRAAFDPRDLRAYQRGAVLKILRAVLRPCFELPVVGGQGLEVLLPLVG